MIVDIHSHILPSIDDGSKDLAMSIDMAKIYFKNNIKKVIATPHYIPNGTNNSIEDNKIALDKLQKKLDKENLDLKVFLGNEVYMSIDTIEDINNGRISTLNNSRYVLLELPMYDIPLYTEDLLYELQLNGFIPIIAHPERNAKIIENPNILYNYIEKGALGQLNLPSLEGLYGSSIKSTAKVLLRHKMIHLVGTDAHSNRNRAPNIGEGLEILESLVDKEEFKSICYKNAEYILEDKLFDKTPPIVYKLKKRSILRLFRRKN